ncbi:MAG: hypothetical protein VZR10_10070 [Methanobrevibacter sp.]|nr:hypothetical protein [Methanobrevibacter sp.]
MEQIKCICDKLRTRYSTSVNIEDYSSAPYIALTMEFGRITAHGEENAYASIKYCPFCGRKFNLIQV